MNFINNKLTTATLIALTLAMFPYGSAKAGDNSFAVGKSVNKHWYLGAAIGVTQLEPKVLISGGSVTDDTSQGVQVYAGYQMNQRLAFEAFYSDLGNAQVDIVSDSSKVDYQAYGVGLVASMPITKKVKLFGKLGYAKLKNEVKENLAYRQVNGSTVNKGIGIGYKLNEKASLRLGYDHYDKDYQFLSLGVQFNF